MKTVCIFGIYDSMYNRSQLFLQGFHANGWRVIECHVRPQQFPGIRKYIELYRTYRSIRHYKFDLVLVAFPGHITVLLARLFFGKNIVFDAFVSLYDSYVYDRKTISLYNPKALAYWVLDWVSCTVARQILLDTNAHITYFVDTFHIPKSKFIRVLAISNATIFSQRTELLSDLFTIHFHGTYIPLQGIGYILEAAHLLKDKPMRFRIVGGGQKFSSIRKRAEELELQNIDFIPYVPLEQLPLYIATAHVCLGIFGDTNKAQRVIPNKVFECMAMGKAIITADTPAIHELQSFGDIPLYLVKTANPKALAEGILNLFTNEPLRNDLGRRAKLLSKESLNAKSITSTLIENLTLV